MDWCTDVVIKYWLENKTNLNYFFRRPTFLMRQDMKQKIVALTYLDLLNLGITACSKPLFKDWCFDILLIPAPCSANRFKSKL